MESEISVLKPPTVWVGNRCYRLMATTHNAESGMYMENEDYPDITYEDDVDCQMESDASFERMENGKIRTAFHVSSAYLALVIGNKGATKMRIESDTHTQIRIPAKGQTGDVVVIGKDVKCVREARLRIEILVDQAKKRQPFTHFLSIPFNKPEIQQNFLKFKNDVLEKCASDRGLEESLFQNALKLHLTICVMFLSDETERMEATSILNQCQESVIRKHLEGKPLRLELRGLEYMNDDPSEIDVLYGKVSDSGRTACAQQLTDDIADYLIKFGVATKQYERVKLHVTLMNSLFRDEGDGNSASDLQDSRRPRSTFDARRILSEFNDFYFGEIEVSNLHLSLRYSTASDGYYSSTAKIQLV